MPLTWYRIRQWDHGITLLENNNNIKKLGIPTFASNIYPPEITFLAAACSLSSHGNSDKQRTSPDRMLFNLLLSSKNWFFRRKFS